MLFATIKSNNVRITLIALLAMALIVMGALHKIVSAFLKSGSVYEWLYSTSVYNRTVLIPSYFEDGFVRRGLGGTIANLLSYDWNISTLLFFCVSALSLSIPIALLIRRACAAGGETQGIWLLIILSASPQTFVAWASDIARTDMLAISFVAWAALSLTYRRMDIAIISILLGLLVHEITIVYGGSLILAVFIDRVKSGNLSFLKAIKNISYLIFGILIIFALQWYFSASSDIIAVHMMNYGPEPETLDQLKSRQIATYMQVAGLRGLYAAVCFNALGGIHYIVWALSGLAVLCVYMIVLQLHRHYLKFAIASLIPTTLMLIVANDAGRWIQLGVLNAILLSLVMICDKDKLIKTQRAIFISLSVLLLLMLFGRAQINKANNIPDIMVNLLPTKAAMGLEEQMQQCDPQGMLIVPRRSLAFPDRDYGSR